MLSVILIGISLSMDAFAVSVTNGIAMRPFKTGYALWHGLYFGAFQFLMPLAGYILGSTVSGYVTAIGPYVSFALLAFIGGNMIREAFGEEEENSRETAQFDWRHMLPLAVACSIDAFAVGVSFAFMQVNIWFSVIVIGVVTGAFSAAGLYIGRVFGARWQKPAQIAGGAVLVLIGLKVLLEHLGFIAW